MYSATHHTPLAFGVLTPPLPNPPSTHSSHARSDLEIAKLTKHPVTLESTTIELNMQQVLLLLYIYKRVDLLYKKIQKLAPLPPHMGWLWLVSSLKSQVSFAEYHLFYRALLQKRPKTSRSLLIVATAELLSRPSSLRMYIYTHTYKFLGVCIYMQLHTYTCTQKIMSVSVYTSIWIYICACTCIYIYMCKCIQAWTYMHIWCMYVYIYTCTYEF